VIIFCSITLIVISIGFIIHALQPYITIPYWYRIIYYEPTGETVGAVFQMNDKIDFYFYQNDLDCRTAGMVPYATERFLRSIKELASKQFLSFDNFEEYFSDNFHISSIVPMIALKTKQYSAKREILKAYKNNKLYKEKKARHEINECTPNRRFFDRSKQFIRRCISYVHLW
jgi:hypothetical protein